MKGHTMTYQIQDPALADLARLMTDTIETLDYQSSLPGGSRGRLIVDSLTTARGVQQYQLECARETFDKASELEWNARAWETRCEIEVLEAISSLVSFITSAERARSEAVVAYRESLAVDQ